MNKNKRPATFHKLTTYKGKTITLICLICKKTVTVPYKPNKKVVENIKRGYKVVCYDCDNKLWWQKEKAGKDPKTLEGALKRELTNKIINFIPDNKKLKR